MTHVPYVLALVAALLLAGCTPNMFGASNLSKEQLEALVKDKNATIACGQVDTPYKIRTVYANLDKGVIVNGKITVSDGCQVVIENDKPAPGQPARPLLEKPEAKP